MRFLLVYFILLPISSILAQTNPPDGEETKVAVDGKIYSALITPDGDTLILTDLDGLQITALRKFGSDDEYKKYMRFRNYAQIVFPYAKEAIRIFRELEYASNNLSRRERKKKIKELEAELSREFEEPLKNLTKLQGKIMIKMIEKETGQPMYHLIKDMKGGFSAFYWNAFSKLYSYDLKEGYNKGDYPILDAVLQDFDVSHRIENGTSLKYIKLNRKKSE
ncbi:MAG: DUF4294 domain-containing protein [Saprospiraceae bacterium]|nr:DUF4294 domain-containing protein [Saprospiraceae bacterium]MBK6564180.1 DUF4294 domain-containing protein [Saprospiraceae bacterium]MBK7524142.1 DUF4294 domain-containing protein [Saprospiraceae bacterium]MBK8078877.1 DUF4294 domain-containing protein [Saprospiraceae bacterium]MBK8372192.1 DUF4294 domain-containing protein [Saprospiraceae bacterium]